MSKTHMKSIRPMVFMVVVMAACLIFLSTSVEAGTNPRTNFAAKKTKPAIEESTALETGTEVPCCADPSACHAQKKSSLGKRLVGGITGFFAFGDRVNHGLTDWILSDKIERAQKTHDCP